MAQGTLWVRNESKVDLYPIVQAKMEEDFGGVSVGAFKVIGFAAIDIDKAARVLWIEGKWDRAREKNTVTFPLSISPQVAEQARHLEFCYQGEGNWVLNLYSAQHPKPEDLLVSIPGEETIE